MIGCLLGSTNKYFSFAHTLVRHAWPGKRICLTRLQAPAPQPWLGTDYLVSVPEAIT